MTWGDSNYGGNSSGVSGELLSGVTSIASTDRAFAAMKFIAPPVPPTPAPVPTLLELRSAQPDDTTRTGIRGGVELVKQRREAGRQQKFPDHASYLQYLKGANYLRGRR